MVIATALVELEYMIEVVLVELEYLVDVVLVLAADEGMCDVEDVLLALVLGAPHLRSLNRVALSKMLPLLLATKLCVICVQLWKVILLQP